MKTATVKSSDPRGLKRICLGCSTRFYDLNKRPIICPNCSAEFSGETKVKSRRGRAASPVEAVADTTRADQKLRTAANDASEEEADEIVADADTVSLDEVEALENADDDADENLDMDDDVEDMDVLEDDDDLEEEITVDKE
ncbi:MAG: TIGR02300 family protein [Alphaproteobacteria bacterium]|nr:TIGR02300 family protein [Alphaproteobacteria bacterium]